MSNWDQFLLVSGFVAAKLSVIVALQGKTEQRGKARGVLRTEECRDHFPHFPVWAAGAPLEHHQVHRSRFDAMGSHMSTFQRPFVHVQVHYSLCRLQSEALCKTYNYLCSSEEVLTPPLVREHMIART